MTGTGYRPHFIPASAIAAAGEPAATVETWLTVKSDAPAWRDREPSAQQLGLF